MTVLDLLPCVSPPVLDVLRCRISRLIPVVFCALSSDDNPSTPPSVILHEWRSGSSRGLGGCVRAMVSHVGEGLPTGLFSKTTTSICRLPGPMLVVGGFWLWSSGRYKEFDGGRTSHVFPVLYQIRTIESYGTFSVSED